MASILLTAARAQRAARQYFGAKSCQIRTTKSIGTYVFYCEAQHRMIWVYQLDLGTVTIEQYDTTDAQHRGPVVFKATYYLPAIGPIDFNHEYVK